jgi:hypothetical protein
MSQDSTTAALKRLRALFQVIAEEAHANPGFARKVEASLTNPVERKEHQAQLSRPARKPAAPAVKAKEKGEAHKMLHNVTFDPLECHIEAALLNGREQEARAFLGKLDQAQLEEVVKAQRLPGAKSLQKTIHEADRALAVDAIVGSAAERVRSRYSAAS